MIMPMPAMAGMVLKTKHELGAHSRLQAKHSLHLHHAESQARKPWLRDSLLSLNYILIVESRFNPKSG